MVVNRYIKELNLDTIKGRDLSRYKYDRSFFNIIDNEKKAYWLGFIYADGCVYKRTLSIRLSTKDKSHLDKFLLDIKSDKTMQFGTQDSFGKETEYVQLQINSVDIVEDLKKLGIVERKSLILNFPSEDIVPKHLQKHFIRGYIDGDGCITRTRRTNSYEIKAVGTENMLNGILKSLEKDTQLRKRRETDSCYYFSIGGNLQVLNILNWLYEDSTVYLDRKYEKYIELKSQYINVE